MFCENSDLGDVKTNLVAINHNFANFATYETVTGGNVNTAESFLSGLKDIYTGIPDNCVFIIFASFSGTYVCLEGLKTTASYGIVTTTSYADAANKRYSILNGTWILKWLYDCCRTSTDIFKCTILIDRKSELMQGKMVISNA